MPLINLHERMMALAGGCITLAGMYSCVYLSGTRLATMHATLPSNVVTDEEADIKPFTIELTPWIKVPLRAPIMLAGSFLIAAITKASSFPNSLPLSTLTGMSTNVVAGTGLALFAASNFLYYSTVKYMVKIGTPVPSGFKVKTLCTHGPFNYLQHPIYTALLGCTLATPFVFDSAYCFLSPISFYLYVFCYVVPREEKYMKDKFGPEYEKFSGRFSIKKFLGME
mmetsp:Transcript_33524/g.52166  ORF Transcript_33524/g.52166 Transcript_33524/m.52166 type:complete len:225 (+) Transcript_33524:283-957(+)